MQLVFREDAYLRSCAATVTAVDERGIRLDATVFYPTGGGQPGDTGILRLADGREIAITDSLKGPSPDEVIHVPAPGAALPEVGASVTAEIDWQRRHRLMRMHSCLHLLSAVIPGDVTGGQVADGKAARFQSAGRQARQGSDRSRAQPADRRGSCRQLALDRR